MTSGEGVVAVEPENVGFTTRTLRLADTALSKPAGGGDPGRKEPEVAVLEAGGVPSGS